LTAIARDWLAASQGSHLWRQRLDRLLLRNVNARLLKVTERLPEAVLRIGGAYWRILAQRRGGYSTAERRYRDSLTIKEGIGDQASIAITYCRPDGQPVRERAKVA